MNHQVKILAGTIRRVRSRGAGVIAGTAGLGIEARTGLRGLLHLSETYASNRVEVHLMG